ncbi:peptidoglycan/xylan/chitin deacetylase (PgdA/CDA1 family) [Propionicimonas paludicola]|uniref:Peptidoglycan/xylan/chitin deacetylase (PgdA/CDA1 family) n=1 Tax=Propionicimonas paludicola TaxID=185243 RepID=A0A2A9CUI6_9ACTN|nr:polysaccharide deacetylase family protein [Propionicimonas paludicola]PFG18048.1 peptidoglycan/xylan/chitin deacetylase (PgdA/CDA1 family) [Propionicimonas paludicola]
MRIGLLVVGVVSSLLLGVQAPIARSQTQVVSAAPQPSATTPVLDSLLAAQAAVLPGEVGRPIPPVDGAPQPPLAGAPQPGSGSSLPKVDCRKHKCIALTLDDGPSPQTARILDQLAALKAPATFFVVGRQVGHYRGVLRRMAAEGHTIGNHSWSHPWFWKLSPAGMRTELDKTNRAIRKLTGVQPRYVRPPYGNVNAAVKKAAKSRGLAVVDWSIDPEDWKVRDTTSVIKRVVGAARPGAIILSHDLYPTTRKAIGPIITKLRAKGYVFVSLDDLLGQTRPGKVYRQRG